MIRTRSPKSCIEFHLPRTGIWSEPADGDRHCGVGAETDDAGYLQGAMHRFGKASGEHQAEASATFTTGVGPQLIKRHEQSGQQLGGNPRAFIGDVEMDEAVDGDVCGDLHGALLRREPNGIGDKVEHHLA